MSLAAARHDRLGGTSFPFCRSSGFFLGTGPSLYARNPPQRDLLRIVGEGLLWVMTTGRAGLSMTAVPKEAAGVIGCDRFAPPPSVTDF
jgi:hypothetical protein